MDPLIEVTQLIQMLILVGERLPRLLQWRLLAPCLRLLEPLAEELRGNLGGGEDLEAAVLLRDALIRARDLVDENAAARRSKVFNVVCCGEIAGWFQEISETIHQALSCISLDSLGISPHAQSQTQLAKEQLQRLKFTPDISDQLLANEIESLLVEMREHQRVKPERLVKLFDKLEIIKDEALTRELDSLESVKDEARLSKSKSREEFYERLISLLMQMVKSSPEGLQVRSEARGVAVPADFRCPLSLVCYHTLILFTSNRCKQSKSQLEHL